MAWKRDVIDFLREVAPEDLQGVPVYIATYKELAEFEPRFCLKGAAGWTGVMLDLLLSELLRQRDEWSGRGFAFAVDTGQSNTTQLLLGTALHELAHWIDLATDDTVQECPEILELFSLRTITAAKAIPTYTPPKEQPAPWKYHEQRFVRAACHLAHRGGELMESLRPQHLNFATSYYPMLSSYGFAENTFYGSLESELNHQGSIREILSTQPPKQFSRLWKIATGK